MNAWLNTDNLVIVSGAGCEPAETVTRKPAKGLTDEPSEIDYVIADTGAVGCVVSCATDDEDGPFADFYCDGPVETTTRSTRTSA